jgi:hypothetical protein
LHPFPFLLFLLLLLLLFTSSACVIVPPIRIPIYPFLPQPPARPTVAGTASFLSLARFSLCRSKTVPRGVPRREQPNAGHSHNAPLKKNRGPYP